MTRLQEFRFQSSDFKSEIINHNSEIQNLLDFFDFLTSIFWILTTNYRRNKPRLYFPAYISS